MDKKIIKKILVYIKIIFTFAKQILIIKNIKIMELSTLAKANELDLLVKRNQKLLNDTMSQTTEFITFSYGNGSSYSVVCSDKKVIEEIRALLRHKYETNIAKFSKELSEL